jgi:predicted nucleic acid-binding protein
MPQRIDSHQSGHFLAGLATLNLTAYDAAYIALAETTNAALYTSDAKLCKGHRAQVVLFTD